MPPREEKEGRRAIDVRITGRVQGVGFRAFTVELARDLGLDGYVENLSDGSVHALAAGPAERIDAFLEGVSRGPRSARVDDVRSSPTESEVPTGAFTVRR